MRYQRLLRRHQGRHGIKYYRITGTTDHKEPYEPDWAQEKAALHAGNFMYNRQNQAEYLAGIMDRQPLVIAPYDAELFGHWWFEGPDFLEYFARKTAYDQDDFRLVTPSEYLEMYRSTGGRTQQLQLGHKGYNEVWLEKSNEWISLISTKPGKGW
jgi:1,4-alpha-glucan branching enzyme